MYLLSEGESQEIDLLDVENMRSVGYNTQWVVVHSYLKVLGLDMCNKLDFMGMHLTTLLCV